MASAIAEEKFREFKWNNKDWLLYYENLCPTPAIHQIEKFKRKWFQRNIDENLSLVQNDCKTKTNHFSSTSSNYNATKNSNYQNPWLNPQILPKFISFNLHSLAIFLSITYLIPFISHRLSTMLYYYAWICYTLGFILDLYLKCGFPKLFFNYFQEVLSNKAGESLLFLLLTFSLNKNPISLIVLSFSSLVSISTFFTQNPDIIPFFPFKRDHFLYSFLSKINQEQYYWMQVQSDIQVLFGFIMFILFFRKNFTIINIILYWQFLKLSYSISSFTQASFKKADSYINGFLNSRFSHPIIKTAYQKIKSVLSTQVHSAQQNFHSSSASAPNTRPYLNRMCPIQ